MSAPPFLRVAQRHTQSDERESKTEALSECFVFNHLLDGSVRGEKGDPDRTIYYGTRDFSGPRRGKQRGREPVLIAMCGNARDLVLPPGSDEFIFLIRRIGYTPDG